MDSDSKIVVAGARGMVGSAIVRNLKSKEYTNVIPVTRDDVDLTSQIQTAHFFKKVQPEYVFVAAAKVGGIMANKEYKADFITDNLEIQTNIIKNAYKFGAKKLLFLGSSCIYPKLAEQPIVEESLMSGKLEPTNDAYAIAKIAGIMMCQAYRQQHGFNAISLMPTNLYGPNDNFDLNSSHVLPAMIRKFHESNGEVTLWGDGSPMREFLHVDDLAEACHVAMQKYDGAEHLNVGTGQDVTIKELAETISDVVGFNGDIIWDTSKPNGTMRKVMDVSKIKSLGWKPLVPFEEGVKVSYGDFLTRFG